MRSKTMKIAGQADVLTVDIAGTSPDGALVARQEKLTFDGRGRVKRLLSEAQERSLPQSGQMIFAIQMSFNLYNKQSLLASY